MSVDIKLMVSVDSIPLGGGVNRSFALWAKERKRRESERNAKEENCGVGVGGTGYAEEDEAGGEEEGEAGAYGGQVGDLNRPHMGQVERPVRSHQRGSDRQPQRGQPHCFD
jgi:hypothetical protein